MSKIEDVIVRTSKWRVSYPPRWEAIKEETKSAKITPKRITIGEGIRKTVFDRETGREIRPRGFSWFRHEIVMVKK